MAFELESIVFAANIKLYWYLQNFVQACLSESQAAVNNLVPRRRPKSKLLQAARYAKRHSCYT